MSETPAPGSPEALERGCECPVTDNGHGKGIHDGRVVNQDGQPIYVFVAGCPLHGAGDWSQR